MELFKVRKKEGQIEAHLLNSHWKFDIIKVCPLICASHKQFTLNNHKGNLLEVYHEGNLWKHVLTRDMALCNYLQVCDRNSPTIQLRT